MEKNNPKFLFEIKMPDRESLTVFKAVDLAVSKILGDGRSVESILEAPAPKRLADMDDEELSRHFETKEYDDINRFAFDDPIEYAEKFPELATKEQLEKMLLKLFHDKKIVLRYPGNLLPVDPSNQIDGYTYLTTKLLFADFVQFANAVNVDVVSDQVQLSAFENNADHLPEKKVTQQVKCEESDSVALSNPTPTWRPKETIERAPGYRWPLLKVLKAAHIAGQACPKAREVLDLWRLNLPSEVSEVMSDGLKYYDKNGETKFANLNAIRQAINNLLK